MILRAQDQDFPHRRFCGQCIQKGMSVGFGRN